MGIIKMFQSSRIAKIVHLVFKSFQNSAEAVAVKTRQIETG